MAVNTWAWFMLSGHLLACASGAHLMEMIDIINVDVEYIDQNSVASDTFVDILPGTKAVDEEFISFSNDVSIMFVDRSAFSSARLHTLMAAMSPAILRIGGSPADWLYFDRPQDKLNASMIQPQPIIMTKQNWDDLVGLSRRTGVRLLFDLNLQQRFGIQWDPSNAIALFDYSAKQGYGEILDWELGNEPTAYIHKGQGQFSGAQIGEDFVRLYKLVHSYKNFAKSRIVGPDINWNTHEMKNTSISSELVNRAGGLLHAFTFHHYYFRGDIAKPSAYTTPHYFSSLRPQLRQVQATMAKTSHPDIPVWIGETSDAWHSGTANVSNRYISGFLWLDKLGVSAQEGVGVVMRQTLYGHNYCLISPDFYPNPDYWLSLLHRRLVGTTVLPLSVKGPFNTRVYAQCTNSKSGYPKGAVTVFALNIDNKTDSTIHVTDTMGDTLDTYLLTPGGKDGLLSQTVNLNGKPLKMVDDNTLPQFKPVSGPSSAGIYLPKQTFGFFVFPKAQLAVCM